MSPPKIIVVPRCVDVRVRNEFVEDWLKDTFPGAEIRAESIPGPDLATLTGEVKYKNQSHHDYLGLMDLVLTACKANSSDVLLVLTGHEDCKGNAVSMKKHETMLKNGAKFWRERRSDVKVMAVLFIEHHQGGDWGHQVLETPQDN